MRLLILCAFELKFSFLCLLIFLSRGYDIGCSVIRIALSSLGSIDRPASHVCFNESTDLRKSMQPLLRTQVYSECL